MIRFFKKIPVFFKQVIAELKKVSWSSKSELFNATRVVLFGSFFLTAFIALADFVLARLLKVLIS
jgi:preprotein translocase SecE subunit